MPEASKNVLFLADRTALVKQAKNNYSNLLQDLSCCNLLDSKDDPEQSRMIFATYPTMMNAIDETKNKSGEKLFTPGHFDLIIVDESHRSIYKKYQDIFCYFDAMLLGMTATPKDDVGKSTYKVFDLENGVPTYAYELDKAVEEHYLVNYSTLEYRSKIMEDGIHYNDLSEEEKESLDDKYEDADSLFEDVSGSAINTWLFNEDTVDKVLIELMDKGLKVEGGDKLGKTIIFAKNSSHAKFIVERFNVLFPECGGDFIKQIDYSVKYADTLIDEFSTKDKMPQIAVSVDMLDTGIDIPEILNLVFFKKVKSYAKFWQMIGRGTRLCPNLFGEGEDKERFLIFDFCNNFEFFRVKTNGQESGVGAGLSEKIFTTKVMIARELQDPRYTSDEAYANYRKNLVSVMQKQVMDLNDSGFRVKRHLQFVEKYRLLDSWNDLESIAVSELKEHIAQLVVETGKGELAKRFDHLIYSIDLGILQSSHIERKVNTVVQIAQELSHKYSIPAVEKKKVVIEEVLTDEFWESVDIMKLDVVREALRDLLQYLDHHERPHITIDIEDQITGGQSGEPITSGVNLKNYKKKVEFYLKEHQDTLAVYKLRNNKKLTEQDLRTLETILWEELGSRADYENEYGNTPIGKLVRKIVGVERDAANEAFSAFLSEEKLNLKQLRFVNLIVDYIVVNGNIEDNSVLMKEPFKTVGSITTLFRNNMGTAKQIMDVIEDIRRNSEEIA